MKEGRQDFRQIYTEYYPKIVGYLRRIVGGLDAEDAAQEAFVKISQSLDGFRGESSLSTWIYRIATNTALDHLRKASRNNVHPHKEDLLTSEDNSLIEDNIPRLDTFLIRKDMNECIRGLVNDLPENYRTVLVLSDLEGFTNSEIVDVLDLSLNTVKIRLHRARLALKKSMDRACTFYRDERNELSCDRNPGILQFRKK